MTDRKTMKKLKRMKLRYLLPSLYVAILIVSFVLSDLNEHLCRNSFCSDIGLWIRLNILGFIIVPSSIIAGSINYLSHSGGSVFYYRDIEVFSTYRFIGTIYFFLRFYVLPITFFFFTGILLEKILISLQTKSYKLTDKS